MNKYLKSAMDFIESNKLTIVIATIVAMMLVGGFVYWRREGMADKKTSDEEDLEAEMEELQEEDEDDEDDE